MRLIFYIDGREVDAVPLQGMRIPLSDLIDDLKAKHRDLLLEGESVAEFVLEGVPSSTNAFTSLRKRGAEREGRFSKDRFDGVSQ